MKLRISDRNESLTQALREREEKSWGKPCQITADTLGSPGGCNVSGCSSDAGHSQELTAGAGVGSCPHTCWRQLLENGLAFSILYLRTSYGRVLARTFQERELQEAWFLPSPLYCRAQGGNDADSTAHSSFPRLELPPEDITSCYP